MAISTAIGSERISRVSGYKILKGNFDNATPNLPQQVVILAEANTANQNSIPVSQISPNQGFPLPVEITTASQAGALFGYGSPIHQIMRILRPASGDGIGGIPTIVIAQLAAQGATATVIVWNITGTATANATHEISINGRETLDYKNYSVAITIGDTAVAIAAKYANAINNVLGSPVIAAASASSATGVLTLTTKWAGLTSASVNTVIDINGVTAGLTYAQISSTAGAGTPDVSGSLGQFEDNWYTTVINSYGAPLLQTLETFNGSPDPINPTGRYAPMVFKPFMAFFGSTLATVSGLTAITDADARVNQVTNVLCPAPASLGFPWEAAANMVLVFCRIMQDTPHLDASGRSYPDMPVPASNTIGEMGVYNNRDLLVQNGCSTVILKDGAYQVQDLVTTYHPDGEVPLQFNYCRNLNLDWNVYDGYQILQSNTVKDHVLVADNQIVDVQGAIKPKEFKAVVFDYFDDLARIALLKDPDFSQKSLQVVINTQNPNRFDAAFNYRRTGIARIESTDATAGY